jgi:DNA-directed RNA polymerase subunit H (RpoH/RPB5)
LRKKEREHIEKQECCNKVKRVIITEEERVEIIKKYGKKHYELHKDELNEKHKEKYDCPCGSTLRIADKSQHELTKKHYNFVNDIKKKILTHQDIKDRQKKYDDKRRLKKHLTAIGTHTTIT